jgi:hypothetical protein
LRQTQALAEKYERELLEKKIELEKEKSKRE